MDWLSNFMNSLSNAIRFWVIIAPWEQAVRIRGGKHAKLLHPGIRLRIPLWDRIYRQSLRERAVGVPPQTLTTADGKAVSVRLVVLYSIDDLMTVYNTLEEVHSVVSAEAAALLSECICGARYADLAQADVEERIEAGLDLTRYGLTPGRVRITDFAAVKTYRLISGDGDTGYWGGGFSTDVHEGASG